MKDFLIGHGCLNGVNKALLYFPLLIQGRLVWKFGSECELCEFLVTCPVWTQLHGAEFSKCWKTNVMTNLSFTERQSRLIFMSVRGRGCGRGWDQKGGAFNPTACNGLQCECVHCSESAKACSNLPASYVNHAFQEPSSFIHMLQSLFWLSFIVTQLFQLLHTHPHTSWMQTTLRGGQGVNPRTVTGIQRSDEKTLPSAP